ncbi:hypothetical protein N9W17_06145 [Jannaschia sp.]|nr:hypothetical protein [Jannaschia sp.]
MQQALSDPELRTIVFKGEGRTNSERGDIKDLTSRTTCARDPTTPIKIMAATALPIAAGLCRADRIEMTKMPRLVETDATKDAHVWQLPKILRGMAAKGCPLTDMNEDTT